MLWMAGILCLQAGFLCAAEEGLSTAQAKGVPGANRAEASPSARRAYPISEKWLIPRFTWHSQTSGAEYTQTFRAELVGTTGGDCSAEWRVTGPLTRAWHETPPRLHGTIASSFRPILKQPGEYTVSCTFVDQAGRQFPISWSLTVAAGASSPLGRKVEPSEPSTMVFIKGGTFLMGPPPGERALFAVPTREVQVGAFYMGKYPVTAYEFCDFLNERGNPDGRYLFEDEKVAELLHKGPELLEAGVPDDEFSSVARDQTTGMYSPRGGLRFVAANQVTWFGAVEYCKWLSQRNGRPYRLPTEAEWEYAARGPEGRKFPWGSDDPASRGNAERSLAEYGLMWLPHCVNVGSFPVAYTPNGIADMGGPDAQWCSDVCPPERCAMPAVIYAPRPSASDWAKPETAPRIVRGLGYGSNRHLLGLTYYWTMPAWENEGRPPGYGYKEIVFRVVMEPGARRQALRASALAPSYPVNASAGE